MAPPRIAKSAGNPMLKQALLGRNARIQGAKDFRELGRILLTNVLDLQDGELTDPQCDLGR